MTLPIAARGRSSGAPLAGANSFAREAEALAKARLFRACAGLAARLGKGGGNAFMEHTAFVEYAGEIVAESGDDLGGSGRSIARLHE